MKIALAFLFAILLLTNSFAADLSATARQKIAAGGISSCMQGAAISAPNLSQLDHEIYCRCYSKKMSEMITSEDLKYFNINKQTSPHMQQVASTAAQYCRPR